MCVKLDGKNNYTYKIQPGISKSNDGLIIAEKFSLIDENIINNLRHKGL